MKKAYVLRSVNNPTLYLKIDYYDDIGMITDFDRAKKFDTLNEVYYNLESITCTPCEIVEVWIPKEY